MCVFWVYVLIFWVCVCVFECVCVFNVCVFVLMCVFWVDVLIFWVYVCVFEYVCVFNACVFVLMRVFWVDVLIFWVYVCVWMYVCSWVYARVFENKYSLARVIISAFFETSPSDCLVSYPGHSLWEGGLTPLQKCSQSILQPQPTVCDCVCDVALKTRQRMMMMCVDLNGGVCVYLVMSVYVCVWMY